MRFVTWLLGLRMSPPLSFTEQLTDAAQHNSTSNKANKPQRLCDADTKPKWTEHGSHPWLVFGSNTLTHSYTHALTHTAKTVLHPMEILFWEHGEESTHQAAPTPRDRPADPSIPPSTAKKKILSKSEEAHKRPEADRTALTAIPQSHPSIHHPLPSAAEATRQHV